MNQFAELLAHPGVVETIELRSRVGICAYHGGNLEELTDTVAGQAAERAGASCYLVCQPDDLRWHIPSHAVGTHPSPALQQFLDHVDVAISIHGYGRDGFWTSVLVGGSNRDLATHVGEHLTHALPGYEVVTDIDAIPAEIRGLHRRNPVNLPRNGGVQIELPPRIRGKGPMWADWPHPELVPPAKALIQALATAARTWPIPASR